MVLIVKNPTDAINMVHKIPVANKRYNIVTILLYGYIVYSELMYANKPIETTKYNIDRIVMMPNTIQNIIITIFPSNIQRLMQQRLYLILWCLPKDYERLEYTF